MITVIGSINMDLVTITGKDPGWGETIIGEQFDTNFGGKGANQAVAAAKLGAEVQMIGAVGNDLYGQEYLSHLENQGVQTQAIKVIQGERTGIAAITVCKSENKIIEVPGANAHITPRVIEEHKHIILNSDWLLLQLEIPKESVEKAIQFANEGKVKVILNPAPYITMPEDIIEQVTWLTPNENEAVKLLNQYKGDKEKLLKKLIITKGEKGVTYPDHGMTTSLFPPKVKPKDTTGAGDTFTGALAVALAEGQSLKEACQFAVKAAALSVTKLGAQSGMPTRKELEE
ncbi:ribokinase [Bacillus sp. AK031]